MSETAHEINKCEKESDVEEDLENQKGNEKYIQIIQNNNSFNPSLCSQYVENKKFKTVDEIGINSPSLDNKQSQENLENIAEPSKPQSSNDILHSENMHYKEISSPSLSSNEKLQVDSDPDIFTEKEFIEIPIDEKAPEHNTGEEEDEGKEATGDNENSDNKGKVTRKEETIWIFLKWILIVVIVTLIVAALGGLIYFFCKGKKMYVPADESKKAYMETHNMTEEDYEIEIHNNRSLARKKYPLNLYLLLPDVSSWG